MTAEDKLNKILEMVKGKIDEDYTGETESDPEGRFGGNIDDAYFGGYEDGEREALHKITMKIMKVIGQS